MDSKGLTKFDVQHWAWSGSREVKKIPNKKENFREVEFKNLLKHFWPLYIETVKNSYIYPIIDEIRIEGHADPDYTRGRCWSPKPEY